MRKGPTEEESRQGAAAWVDGYKTGFEDGMLKSQRILAAVIKQAGGEVFLPLQLLRELDSGTAIEEEFDPVSDSWVYRTRP